MFKNEKVYSFKFGTPWEEIKNFDPYAKHKEIAKTVICGIAFISLEIAMNLYTPSVPAPAFVPDESLLDVGVKAFKALKSVGL